jgi:hypothetical protein
LLRSLRSLRADRALRAASFVVTTAARDPSFVD